MYGEFPLVATRLDTGVRASQDVQVENFDAPYHRVATAVREAIRDGRYKIGDPIPSRAHLADEHQVSPMTVNNALRVLKAEGLIAAVPGRGTYVKAAPGRVPFALVSLGPEVYECGVCSALVDLAGRDRHAAYHGRS